MCRGSWIVRRGSTEVDRVGKRPGQTGQDRIRQGRTGQGRAGQGKHTLTSDYYLVTPALALCRKGPDCCTRKASAVKVCVWGGMEGG